MCDITDIVCETPQDSFIPQMASDNPVRREMIRLLGYHLMDPLIIKRFPDGRNRTTHGVDVRHHSPAILFTLGDLDVLPIEMLNAALQFSDLHTLSEFSHVNRQAKEVVDGFIPYKLIKTLAPHLLVVLTRTEVVSHFTVGQVVDVLCSKSCSICGRFGTYLWIPDCIRCCFSCLHYSPNLMPMSKKDAKAAFGLSERELSKVPIMYTLPGRYTPHCGLYKRRRWLLSRETARNIALEIHGGEEGLNSYINSNTSRARA